MGGLRKRAYGSFAKFSRLGGFILFSLFSFGGCMKNLFSKAREAVSARRAALAASLAALGGQAMAAVDTTAVGTALTAAQTSGETVGGQVIGVVAGLVVVGVIIALVRKV